MNIEEAAGNSGIEVDGVWFTGGKTIDLERFAQIIRNQALEDAAKCCEQSDEDGEGPDCWDWHAKDFSAAISAMKEQT